MTQLELLPQTQTGAILAHLQSGATLTPLEALHKFGCLRLGARCFDLRQRGYKVHTEMIDVGIGKRVARYSLKP